LRRLSSKDGFEENQSVQKEEEVELSRFVGWIEDLWRIVGFMMKRSLKGFMDL
jgi:hypothetical protein